MVHVTNRVVKNRARKPNTTTATTIRRRVCTIELHQKKKEPIRKKGSCKNRGRKKDQKKYLG